MEKESYIILENGRVERVPWCAYTNPEYPRVIDNDALRVYAPNNASLKGVFLALRSKLGEDVDFEYIFESMAKTGVYGDKSEMISQLLEVA